MCVPFTPHLSQWFLYPIKEFINRVSQKPFDILLSKKKKIIIIIILIMIIINFTPQYFQKLMHITNWNYCLPGFTKNRRSGLRLHVVWAKTISAESRLTFKGVRYLSDNRVALAWVERPSRSYKPFVSSRIGEIRKNSEPSNWSHCPTKHNVAENITRGIINEEMNARWLVKV